MSKQSIDQGKLEIKLLAIVGETASGKTALSLVLADKLNGEIICADSRTVYRGMDIGTAKPTIQQRNQIRHHLLDVINPNQHFTAAEFQRLALLAIDDIKSRGKLPIVVGGSGLYIDSLLYGYTFRSQSTDESRNRYDDMSVAELQNLISELGYDMPHNYKNKRHLTRVLESRGEKPSKQGLLEGALIIGLRMLREEQAMRIEKRVREMVDEGIVTETKLLIDKWGTDARGLMSTSYKALVPYILGDTSLNQAVADFIKNDKQLAKKQRTWFKRSNDIHWFESQQDALDYLRII